MRLSFSRIASWLGGFALTFGAVQVAGNELLHLQDSNLQFSTLPYSAGESFLSFATERPAFTAGLSPKALAELPGHTPAPLQMRLSGAQAAPAPGQGGPASQAGAIRPAAGAAARCGSSPAAGCRPLPAAWGR